MDGKNLSRKPSMDVTPPMTPVECTLSKTLKVTADALLVPRDHRGHSSLIRNLAIMLISVHNASAAHKCRCSDHTRRSCSGTTSRGGDAFRHEKSKALHDSEDIADAHVCSAVECSPLS